MKGRSIRRCTKPRPSLFFDPDVCGHSADEPNQLLIRAHPHPTVPCLLPPWRLQGPAQERLTVVKPVCQPELTYT